MLHREVSHDKKEIYPGRNSLSTAFPILKQASFTGTMNFLLFIYVKKTGNFLYYNSKINEILWLTAD